MRVFARSSKTGATYGNTILTPETLVNWASHCIKRGYNVYIQMNPTRKKGAGRVSSADISHWCWFLVDLDPTSERPDLGLAEEFVGYFMMNYLGLTKLHYHLVNSGRGWQLWFPLKVEYLGEGIDDPKVAVHTQSLPRMFDLYDISEDNTMLLPLREAAPRAMSYWLNLMKQRLEQAAPNCGVTIDTSVSDLPRVMRMPGTLNFKTFREAHVMREAKGVNLGLGHKLIHYAPYNVWRNDDAATYAMAEGATYHHYLVHPGMKVAARKFITEGETEGGRHKAAAAALLSLKELGCNATEAEAALLWGARLCSPPLDPREITPMIDRHFQRRKA